MHTSPHFSGCTWSIQQKSWSIHLIYCDSELPFLARFAASECGMLVTSVPFTAIRISPTWSPASSAALSGRKRKTKEKREKEKENKKKRKREKKEKNKKKDREKERGRERN